MKTKIPVFLVCAALIVLAACNGQMGNKSEPGNNDKAAMMKERYRILDKCFSTGNTAAIDTLVIDNVIDHSEDTAMHLPKGKEGLKQLVAMMRQGTPDLTSDIKYMAVDGDILMVYGTMGGTNSGPMQGMPATNKKWSADYADVIRFDNNMKMAEHWGLYDQVKIMKDLGMMPPPPGAAAMNKPAALPEKK
jgi:predicted ester cyclase